MAESIALGMRLATADELATVAGIEGEISVTEGEWRAVVHDGVTKGGYPLAKLAEAGYSLTKSEDGTKLQLKNKNGVVLSETDAPAGSGGSGVHVGNEAPTDTTTDIWLDLDEDSPAIEVDTSNLIKKEGLRGYLGGYELASFYECETEGESPNIVTLASPDAMVSTGMIAVSSYLRIAEGDLTPELGDDDYPFATKVMLWMPVTEDDAQIYFLENLSGMPFWHVEGETVFEAQQMYLIVFQFCFFFGYANITKLNQIEVG